MCVCLRFHLASRLAPLSSSPPCVAAGWHAGWVNRKKKGAKEKQEKEIWLTNLTTYQVYHVHGFAVHVTTFLRCLLSPTACCTLSQVKAPKGKPHAPHVVQDVRNKKDGYLKYKKVFYAFPFPLPLDLPLVVGYAFLRVLGALRASSGIASGVASMCLACSACSTDSTRPAVDVDPR